MAYNYDDFELEDDFEMEDELKCPRCGSRYINSSKQGFGLGKAAVGGLLLGPIGLLGGCINSNKIKCTWLKCGKTWNP